jgi:RNA polymerase sigma-70 factor (ECF subfamily)
VDAVLTIIKPIFAAHDARPEEADASLIERCQAGERTSFGILLNRYRDRIINLAYQLLHDRDDAEDVAQEVFTKAFTSIGSFRAEAQLFTWLYRITLNLCLHRKRREKRCESYEEQIVPGASDANEDQIVTNIVVQQALDKLSPPLQAVLILREMHDLSYEEIAIVLNIPVGTVRSRLSEARRKFKELWEALEQ